MKWLKNLFTSTIESEPSPKVIPEWLPKNLHPYWESNIETVLSVLLERTEKLEKDISILETQLKLYKLGNNIDRGYLKILWEGRGFEPWPTKFEVNLKEDKDEEPKQAQILQSERKLNDER